VYDASYENGELAAVAAFVPGNDALCFASQPEDTRRKVVLDCLVCACTTSQTPRA
jgi:hypothetical protein